MAGVWTTGFQCRHTNRDSVSIDIYDDYQEDNQAVAFLGHEGSDTTLVLISREDALTLADAIYEHLAGPVTLHVKRAERKAKGG